MTKRSEFAGGDGMPGTTDATDRLRNLYGSGDETNTNKDDGNTWEGLLPLDEVKALQERGEL